MTFLLFLLLFFLGYFVIWPMIRIALKVNSARNSFRNAMGGFTGEPHSARQERRGGWSAEGVRVRRKKIGRDVGEYVPFEENPSKMPPSQGGDFTAEQQVVDAEWEDIK